MIIVIAGMYRSGSTFSFNVVRELLERDGPTGASPTNSLSDALVQNPGVRHLIIKSHGPEELLDRLIGLGACLCVCTFRRPEDAILSWQHAFGFDLDASIAAFRSWLKWREQHSVPALDIPYELIDRHPLTAILLIQQYVLGNIDMGFARQLRKRWSKSVLKSTYDQLSTEADGIQDLGFSFYDKRTFFHRRHISSVASRKAADHLSAEVIDQIRAKLAPYVGAHGEYARPSIHSNAAVELLALRAEWHSHRRQTCIAV